ncbi:PaaI family thioesterase [Rhizobiaceae bacterium BDR2-2]|uniref:PaaI family thioesterase n=1 Tax=Ectorhizobium quercum TaxID=2965071 RepID=A0AAE3N1A7_9HYPH|nr:PaaI family thioesterase [Ectorhizobium quercum]MCX8998071.1 PaaI family thioesterase [Ectorhizobium quercum]
MTEIHDRLRHRFFALYDGIVAFHDWCGLRYLSAEADDVRLVMPFLPRLSGSDGAIAPAMTFALADVAAGQAAAAAFGWRTQVATVSLQQAVLAPIPKGAALLAFARARPVQGDFVLTEITISAKDAPHVPLVLAQGRMIAVRRVELNENEAPPIPPRADFSIDPLSGPAGMVSEIRADVLVGRLAFRPQFMGNASRGALHGGLIAAALHTAAERFGGHLVRPLSLLDGTVDFLASGRPGDLAVTIHAERTGNRVAFVSGRVEQDRPGGGERVLVARLNAVLGLRGAP